MWNVWLGRNNRLFRNYSSTIKFCLHNIDDDYMWWTCIKKGTEIGQSTRTIRRDPHKRLEPSQVPKILEE